MKPGDLISRKYRLTHLLGEGGMAEVWAATHEITQRQFAIKVILPSLAKHPEAVERFFQEARAAGRVRHPSIVDVIDVGTTPEGRPYLVMELLAGESLASRLARERRLSPLTTAVLFSQVARGLHLAHRAGVVHRDLSTANVFLAASSDGGDVVPKILDFGVSKILTPGLEGRVRTGSGAVLGSPAYMSPEQARGAENVDERTDVWALGVLLYECSSGKTPFIAKNYNALMLAIVSLPHVPISELEPGLDPALAAAIESCLVKDREARTQTALELAERLEDVARRLAHGRHVPLGPARRVTDRLPVRGPVVTVGSVPLGARLPPGTFPVGVRCWRFLTRRSPPSGWMAAGAFGGTALGVLIGISLASHRPAPPKTAERAATGEEKAAATRPEPPAAEPRTAPAPAETDLVQATAKALGVRRKALPDARPTAVAALPRKNPY